MKKIIYVKVEKDLSNKYQLVDPENNVIPVVNQLTTYMVSKAFKKKEAIRVPILIETKDDGTTSYTVNKESSLLQRVKIELYEQAVAQFIKRDKS